MSSDLKTRGISGTSICDDNEEHAKFVMPLKPGTIIESEVCTHKNFPSVVLL
jgi:hypothetical protein